MRYGIIPKHRHDRELLMHFADRFEAAVKSLEADHDNWRRQALDEDARANATHKDSLVVGDMAAMREAFEEMLAWYDELHDDVAAMDAAMEKARAALAKPPRNCDVGTPEEQEERFKRYCMSGDCKRYVCNSYGYEKLFRHKCALIWGQLPYKKGATHEQK